MGCRDSRRSFVRLLLMHYISLNQQEDFFLPVCIAFGDLWVDFQPLPIKQPKRISLAV